ncbi:MAG: D-glycerate dehydrogenase [Paracoccus sp. (in: a-proteobacteria)]|nr:D-glycerate dehydrogenase [Paracoccus sp. (in: a-proteobacteria)]
MKLLVTRRMTAEAEARIGADYDATFRDSEIPLTEPEAAEALGQYDAIMPTLGDAFNAACFAQTPSPRAKILANFGAGFNHIDVEAARAAGVAVTNTPDVVTDATAELAVTLLLMTARRAGEGERLLRRGAWTGWAPTQLLGMSLSGRRVGIIGMGRIGKAIAARLHHGFGVKIAYFNRSPVAETGVPAEPYGSLHDLLGAVDAVILAVPGGAGTRHLIGAAELARLGPDAIIVNIARGDVIDEDALIAALQAGQIRAAGLDVYAREPEIPDALRERENAVLLPHLGTAVEETRTAMALRAKDNLDAFARGSDLPDRVG